MACSGRSYLPRWAGGGVYACELALSLTVFACLCAHARDLFVNNEEWRKRSLADITDLGHSKRERGMGRRWRDLWQTHVTCRPGELCTWCCGRLWGTTLEEEQPKVGGCWGLLSGLVFVASFQHGPALWTLLFYGFPRSPVPLPPLFIVFSPRWADASHMLRDHSVKSVTVTFPMATCSHSTKAFMQQM